MTAEMNEPAVHPGEDAETRRDFLYLTAGAMAAVGTAAAVWPLIDSMNPAADVRALTSVDADLRPIDVGQRITVKWRGEPVFINRCTPGEIEQAKADDSAELPDPEVDSARVQRGEWLIVIGVCTHLGCVPKGQNPGDLRGEWNGWFCPCHGSHYDTSGRIRKGPAPKNLVVPKYLLLDGTTVRIG